MLWGLLYYVFIGAVLGFSLASFSVLSSSYLWLLVSVCVIPVVGTWWWQQGRAVEGKGSKEY